MKRLTDIFHRLNYKKKMIAACIMVGIIPLTVLGTFCYYQTVHLLLSQEKTALSSAVSTAYSSLEREIQIYEDLLQYLAHSDTFVQVSSKEYTSVYEKFELLNYSYDTMLQNIYMQHPEISRITLYADRDDLSHGAQLRPLTDLMQEEWYTPDAVTAKPSWHVNNDGSICVVQRIPDPFIKFVSSYSTHCVAVVLTPENFFGVLTEISQDHHLVIASDDQVFFEYKDPSILYLPEGKMGWTTRTSKSLPNGWIITLEKPSAILTAPADFMVMVVILAVFSCILFMLVVSNRMSDFFAGKVSRLLSAMQNVRSGDLSIHISDDCPDEIGELTNRFQDMIDELNRLVIQDYQNKITLKETQLMALQAQINPHFLYNCLSLINSKALLNRQPEISQMAQLLSTFYRTTLNKGKSDTLLENEIKNVRSYIEIQLLLNDDAFDVTYQIDSCLPHLNVPNLLLQPLVENAIVHGILPNKTKRGKLFVTVMQINDRIHFSVLDNGMGIPPEKLPLLTQTQSDGYGLKNVHERLLLTYGEGAGLSINSTLMESTLITFSIPVQPQCSSNA